MNILISIAIIILLIALNALFVAAEFSAVSAKASKIFKLAQEGNNSAAGLYKVISNPKNLDAYIATSQVGITLSSLALGYFGQAELAIFFTRVLTSFGKYSEAIAGTVSATIVLIILSVFQILLGELVPKNLGIQFPEKISLLTRLPMKWAEFIFKPLIILFNGSGILIMRLLGVEASAEHGHIHSPEEIALLVEESGIGGAINPEEHHLLKNTLTKRKSMVRKMMIPRSRMLAANIDTPNKELLVFLANSPYSRIPIYKGSIDSIIGVVHLRDLVCNKSANVSEILYSVPFIPETMVVKEAFALLQNKNFQVAIVMDEYGGTAGMVTLEDLLEQIFGDFQDEFDTESPKIWHVQGNQIWISGEAKIEHVNKLLGIKIHPNDSESIGGAIFEKIGHVPILNEEIWLSEIEFRIEKMNSRGVGIVSLEANPQQIEAVDNRNLKGNPA
ncbi:MAG: hemolysin family protein [Chloroflexota bacterium]